MKNYKRIAAPLIFCIAVSCNNGNTSKTASAAKPAVDSMLKANDSTISGAHSNTELKKLLLHFPFNNKFPVVTDSAYMANVAKGHDSLGTNEVKMLVRFWHHDELLYSDSNDMCNFYKIDSLKAHHKFTGQYTEGMPTYSNAYTLQQIGMPEQTLLTWALVSVQEDADPIYRTTTIYYTLLNNNTILETGIMGRLITGMDPPAEGQTILSSALNADGKLLMEQNEFTGDLDSLTAETKHTRYEYLIHQGYTKLQSKKEDAPKDFKLKSAKTKDGSVQFISFQF